MSEFINLLLVTRAPASILPDTLSKMPVLRTDQADRSVLWRL